MPENPTSIPTGPSAVIACGGTGGHFFPGLAVAEELRRRGCRVTLMVSPKDVDQQAIASISGMGIVTLPAVGLNRGGWISFISGFCKSYRLARRLFALQRPDVVLAMGGFVSAPPVMAGRRCGAKTFLHESNSIPGRANRWLARWVDGAFVYFSTGGATVAGQTGGSLRHAGATAIPQPADGGAGATALGLNPKRAGSAGHGRQPGRQQINELALAAVPALRQAAPDLQFMHLTGARDLEKVRAGYRRTTRSGLGAFLF
jgi:UDP-N-acetylglucosamine--N-acetylmuramyl-(pentapeptide) pyrophosphoryl-undecaprenol N-acetylglucosamine transferase